jgi:pteridine reductase
MDSMNESDRVALVTGASRRIGAEIVRGLHAAGYQVLLHYHRSEEAARQLAGALNADRPDSVLALRADLDDTAALDELVRRAIDAWGHLDALVNNASTFYATPLGTVTESQWDALLGSNLKAPFFLCQAAAPHLASRQGAIVNLVDIYAERPLKGYPAYSIAKAGLAALTRSLAVELAPDVRVNGVAPGAILWPEQADGGQPQADILARIPLARSGSPGDIAGAVRFLLEGAPYITGQIIAVDGGRSVFI